MIYFAGHHRKQYDEKEFYDFMRKLKHDILKYERKKARHYSDTHEIWDEGIADGYQGFRQGWAG